MVVPHQGGTKVHKHTSHLFIRIESPTSHESPSVWQGGCLCADIYGASIAGRLGLVRVDGSTSCKSNILTSKREDAGISPDLMVGKTVNGKQAQLS